jgi:1,4-dihydroxy-2-naphthoate octaprenyltransferase
MAPNPWLELIRVPFLLLSVVLVLLGTSVAIYGGSSFNLLHFILALVGLVLIHISVNVLNNYFDYKSGIDKETKKTPFSGGVDVLVTGTIKPGTAYRVGLATLGIGLLIGVYFFYNVGWELLPLVAVGAFSVYFYTPVLAKLRIGEAFAGLGLGTLPVMGAYFVQAGTFNLPALIASIPSWVLTHNLLLLNEFPDAEVDEKAGRKHLVISLGKRNAGIYYSFLVVVMYLWIIGAVALGYMPYPALLALLTIPKSLNAIKGALKDYDKFEEFIPAQAANVQVVLGTHFLLALGFIVASFL